MKSSNALDRHRALLAAATPGPFYVDADRPGPGGAVMHRNVIAVASGDAVMNKPTLPVRRWYRDADLFAAAVNAHPLLLDLWAAAKDMHGAVQRLDPDTYKVADNYVIRIGAILAKLEKLK